MIDRAKVIKGLEICTADIPMSNAVHKFDFCKECPYYNANYSYCCNLIVMMRDALALLKEQNNCENCAIAIEDRQPVVRCKNCKYSKSSDSGVGIVCDYDSLWHEADWFCADGERR